MKRFLGLLLGLLMILPGWGICHVTGEQLEVGAGAAVVMEASTGRLLFSQNPQKRLPIASTTKIMTALLTLEQPGLDEPFEVDGGAIAVEGTSMGLQKGDEVTLRILAAGMLMSSGNDAANGAAVRIAGSIPAFAEKMNRRAEQIGMFNSHFVTPSGLDADSHYSTAEDMALLAREALKNPVFAEMAASRKISVRFGNPPYVRTLANHNRLLGLYPETVGIKTGFTRKAGRCLVSAARRDGVTLICVTLNCGDDWNTHQMLYERYFPMVRRLDLWPRQPILIPVTGGTESSVRAFPVEIPGKVLIQGEPDEVEIEIFCPNFLYAPVLEGDNLGRIVYYISGTPVGECNLRAASEIPAVQTKQEPFWNLWKGKR